MTENSGLAWSLARRYARNPFFPYEDACGQAMLALCRSVTGFVEGTAGRNGVVSFAAYASSAICRELKEAQRRAFRAGITGEIGRMDIRPRRLAEIESDDPAIEVADCPEAGVDHKDLAAFAVKWLKAEHARVGEAVDRCFLGGQLLREAGDEMGISKQLVQRLREEGISMIRRRFRVTA